MFGDIGKGFATTQLVADDVQLGDGTKLYHFINLYGCEIGDQSQIGCFVEVQKGAKIGARCKISSHTFVCEGVTIEDEVLELPTYHEKL